MNCKLLAVGVTLLSPSLMGQAPVCPGATTYTWQGDQSETWSDGDNWDLESVPGSDDIAYIPSVDLAQNSFPEITGVVSVCALKMEKTGNDPPTLTLKYGASPGNMTIGGQNGLNVGADCEIQLQKSTVFTLSKPGTVALDGRVVFKSSLPQQRPVLYFPEGATILTGSGSILGENRAGLFGATGHESQCWLVVGPDNGLYGELTIDVGLINNGIVDPNGGLSEPQSGVRVMNLTCTPKMGNGQWKATGGTEEYRHRLSVSVDVVSTGTVTIGNYGELHVNRHMMVSGGFTMEGNGKVVVPWFILFDIRQFAAAVCDYTGS